MTIAASKRLLINLIFFSAQRQPVTNSVRFQFNAYKNNNCFFIGQIMYARGQYRIDKQVELSIYYRLVSACDIARMNLDKTRCKR